MSDCQLAAIAVCPDAVGGGLLSVTLVSGPPNEPLLPDSVEHKLQDLTPEAVASAIARIVADISASTTSIALLLPLALTWHHKDRYEDAIRNLPGVHIWRISPHANPTLVHFASDFPPDEEVKLLFLDLTPGHAAASLRNAEAYDAGQVFYTGPMDEPAFIDTTTPDQELSPQHVIDKLITPKINPSSSNPVDPNLHGIHIFRPGGPCPALSSALESKFPDTPIKWISLSEISRTAATMLRRDIDTPSQIMCALLTYVPLQITLADGRLVPAVPRNWFLPLKRTVVVTTSEDDQRTATIQFVNGDRALGTVVVDGLAGRSRGAPRIEVSVEIDHDGATSVRVDEVGSGVTVAARLGNVLDGFTNQEITAYVEAHPDEDSKRFDQAEVIGELPA